MKYNLLQKIETAQCKGMLILNEKRSIHNALGEYRKTIIHSFIHSFIIFLLLDNQIKICDFCF